MPSFRKLYPCLPLKLKKDRNICIQAMKIDLDNLAHAPFEFINNKNIIKTAISNWGIKAFKYASKIVQYDIEFVVELARKVGVDIVPYLPKPLKEDSILFAKLVRIDSKFVTFLPSNFIWTAELFRERPEIIKHIKKEEITLEMISYTLEQNPTLLDHQKLISSSVKYSTEELVKNGLFWAFSKESYEMNMHMDTYND